jgi:hypothetical protein
MEDVLRVILRLELSKSIGGPGAEKGVATTEVMVNGPDDVYVERKGRIERGGMIVWTGFLRALGSTWGSRSYRSCGRQPRRVHLSWVATG